MSRLVLQVCSPISKRQALTISACDNTEDSQHQSTCGGQIAGFAGYGFIIRYSVARCFHVATAGQRHKYSERLLLQRSLWPSRLISGQVRCATVCCAVGGGWWIVLEGVFGDIWFVCPPWTFCIIHAGSDAPRSRRLSIRLGATDFSAPRQGPPQVHY